MAQQVFGPAAVVSVLNRAFTNTSPSNAVFNNQLAQAGTTEASQYAFAESFGATFAVGKTAAELSALVMANMGLDNQLLADALTDYITVHGTNKIGIIAYQLGTLLSPLENDATYGAAAKAWNAEVTAAYEYSADPSNTVPSTSDVNGNEAGKNFVLTAGQDVRTGTSGADFFRGVAGVQVGNQDQTTLNSSDILDGGAGQDTLILNLTGANYIGGARIKNIETLQIGTNLGLANFDYNVNAGQNEITEVTTIVYDQINVNETLTVNNILKTGEALPTLAWKNEAGSQAGTVNATYRASAVAGATDQAVELHNVMAVNADATTGRLNIGGGVETLTITSTGTTANTLNASTNFDGRNADLVSGSNDGVPDNGLLTKVVVKGDQAFGRTATVVTNDVAGEASFGLTNRAAASDLGLNNNQASASNLISVAGTVTEIDATEADGGVAMRFVGRNDNGAVNVTFKGGKAADYIEFERGNVNASGGEGNDTFAFINNALTSFDFGSADTIVGGAGVDTIQLGVNGVGTVVANTTEFNNKTGIDVLDLRGATNTVTLADAFVAGADVDTFTVRTDKIVQVSDASTANTAPSNATNNAGLENNSVNTIVLTELADNRAIEFIGGSGSDRVVVDNASANQFTKLDGGTNAAAGSNDSLTVVDTSVLDSNDVRNIKNFEFINLVETTTTNSNFTLALSEAFALANNNGLVLGSTTGTYGNRLQAGDVVNLEVSDLLNAGALKTSLVGRTINVQDLIAAGVTVNYQINGVTQAGLPAGLAAFVVTNVAPAATILDDVAGAVAGGGGAVAPTVGTLTATSNILGTAANENWNSSAAVGILGAATLNGAGGTDSITLTDAGAAALTATITNIESIILNAGGNQLTFNAANSVANVVGGAGADTVTVTAGFVAGGSITLGGGADLLVIGDTVNRIGTTYDGGAGPGDDVIQATANANLSGSTITGFEQLQIGANNVTLNTAQFNGLVAGVTSTAAGQITFADAGSVTIGLLQQPVIYNLSAAGNSITVTHGNAVTVNGGAGNDTIVGGSGNNAITGGAGADVINVGTGTDTVFMTATGQTFSALTAAALTTATTAGTATALTGIDKVTGMAAADIINLAGVSATFTGAVGTTVAAATGTTVSLVRGNFVDATGIFTTDAAGTSTLVVYDADAAGAGTAVEAIVLVGSVVGGAAAAGVLTLA